MVYRSASLQRPTHHRSVRVEKNNDDNDQTNYLTDMDARRHRRGSHSGENSRRSSGNRQQKQQRRRQQYDDDFEYPDYYYHDNYWEPEWDRREILPKVQYNENYYAGSYDEPFVQRPRSHLPRKARRSMSLNRHNSSQMKGGTTATFTGTTEPFERRHSLSAPYQDHHQQKAGPSVIISDEPFDNSPFPHHQQVNIGPERRHTIQEDRATAPHFPNSEPPMAPQPLQRRHSMYEPSTNSMASPVMMPIYGNGNIPPYSGPPPVTSAPAPAVAAAGPWMQPVPRPVLLQPGFHVPKPMIQQSNILHPIRPMPFLARYPDFPVVRPMIAGFPGMIPPPPMLGPHGIFPFADLPAPPFHPVLGHPLPQLQARSELLPPPPPLTTAATLPPPTLLPPTPPMVNHSPPQRTQIQNSSGDPNTSSSLTSSALPAAAAAAIAGAAVAMMARKEEQKKEEQKKEEQKKEEQKKQEPKNDKTKKDVKIEEQKKDKVAEVRDVNKEEDEEEKKKKKDKDESTDITKNDSQKESSKDGEHKKKSPELKKEVVEAAAAVAAPKLRRSGSLFGRFFGGGEKPEKHRAHIQNRSLWDPQRVMSMDDAMYVEPQRQPAAATLKGIYPAGHPLNKQLAKVVQPSPPQHGREGILSRKESKRIAAKAQRLRSRRYIWCYRPLHDPVGNTVVWAAFDVVNQERLQRYIGVIINNEPLLPGTPTSITMSSEPELQGTTIIKPLDGVGFHYKSRFSSKPILLQIRCLPNQGNLLVRGPPSGHSDMPMNSAPPLSFGSQQSQGIASRLWDAIAN